MKHKSLIIFIVLFAAISYLGGTLYFKEGELQAVLTQKGTLKDKLALESKRLTAAHIEFADAQKRLLIAEELIANLRNEREDISQELQTEKEKVGPLEEKVAEITGAVGTITKLSELDPELMQKYSKVYFLNEHYTPKKLAPIDNSLTYERKNIWVHTDALTALYEMMGDARGSGNDLLVLSAYRSFGEQSAIKSNLKVVYGEDTANAFSADQGYSEHQLGTAVDFTTSSVGATFEGFENTAAYRWLLNNAHRYGFILSYPTDNTFYQFEPWHWRLVGRELATKLYEDKVHFYDVDQRELNKYLISIFD